MVTLKHFAVSLAISLAVLATVITGRSAAQAGAALTGIVSSQAEGPMEGVLVSAKRAGSTLTTTVVSDAKGRYAFPGGRLEPGAYTIGIRATGYDLEGPSSVDVRRADRAARSEAAQDAGSRPLSSPMASGS
jgi:hypothetical protein